MHAQMRPAALCVHVRRLKDFLKKQIRMAGIFSSYVISIFDQI